MAVGPDNTSNEKQEFLILSIPRIPTTDNSKEFSYLVTSKYCSVEYLEYLPETEEVKWTMATTVSITSLTIHGKFLLNTNANINRVMLVVYYQDSFRIHPFLLISQ